MSDGIMVKFEENGEEKTARAIFFYPEKVQTYDPHNTVITTTRAILICEGRFKVRDLFDLEPIDGDNYK